MQPTEQKSISRRQQGNYVWLEKKFAAQPEAPISDFFYNVIDTEEAIGRAMFDELARYLRTTSGDVTIVLLGGRGAQAMYRTIAQRAKTGEIDEMLGRLNVFTQDALAPLRIDNGFSFVRDFERLLGKAFFEKVKSFTPMQTETDDLEGEMVRYLEKIEESGGIDIFFLGLGPEANAASHLCYIKPDSGATYKDLGGIIPISSSILEHHISKFKAGGSRVSESDERECRNATHIMTLGPAAILAAKKIVQSIVDASTAPAKRDSFARMIETVISDDIDKRANQLDQNPGLWVRMHANVSTFVLPDLF